jgi:hypothetical protein
MPPWRVNTWDRLSTTREGAREIATLLDPLGELAKFRNPLASAYLGHGKGEFASSPGSRHLAPLRRVSHLLLVESLADNKGMVQPPAR